MCVFSVAYRTVTGCPILLLTNRDESTARPTRPPQAFPATSGDVRWFGGTDARAGGTWLGINQHGLIAAITNRKKEPAPINPRSRGLLCRDMMAFATADEAVQSLPDAWARHVYAGFNLIVLAADSFWVFEAVDQPHATRLEPGIHTIGNDSPETEGSPRDRRTHALVEQMLRGQQDWRPLIDRAKHVLSTHAEGNQPAICLHGEGWGTVGSTVVALPEDLRQAQYHYAAGPPCRTPFVDYSRPLREIWAN